MPQNTESTAHARPIWRRALAWLTSFVVGGALLWLASHEIELLPTDLGDVDLVLLSGAIALHVPYAIVRAARLQFIFDPLVRVATDERHARFDRRTLYGSGLVSFFVLLMLPFKLGEVSRPALIARARQPGVALTEAVSAAAIERWLDAGLISILLFAGLVAGEVGGQAAGSLRAVGGAMLAFVVTSGVVLMLLARREQQIVVALERWSLVGERWTPRMVDAVQRACRLTRTALSLTYGGRFVLCSMAYWLVTVLQLWLVASACGLTLSFFAAGTIVAVVGLSIQLPGGPAQSGTFQVGMSLGLALFIDGTEHEAAASAFVFVMYLLQVLGGAVLAVPGAILWFSGRAPGDDGDASSP